MSDQSSGVGERGEIVCLVPLIDAFSHAGFGDEVVSNTFDLVGWGFGVEGAGDGEDAAVWVSTHDEDLGVEALDFSGDTGDGSSCSDTDDDGVDSAVTLVVDFLTKLVKVC